MEKIFWTPNSVFGQSIGRYEERERHLRMCMASGNQYVFHWLKRSQNKELILEKNVLKKLLEIKKPVEHVVYC